MSCEDDNDEDDDGNSFHVPHTWRKVWLTASQLFLLLGSEVETRGYQGCQQLCLAQGHHMGSEQGKQCYGQLAESLCDLALGSRRLLLFTNQCENEVLPQCNQNENI